MIQGQYQKGYMSFSVMLLMLVVAMISLELASQAGHRLDTTSASLQAMQKEFGVDATIQYGLWKVKNDTTWRTAASGQAYTYAGTDYTLKVLDCSVTGYEDAVTITASAAGATRVTGVGIRKSNTLILSDTMNHRLRELDLRTGIIKTIAGIGTAGYSAGEAVSMKLNTPFETAVNSKGEILIADTLNHIIRKIDTSGNVSRVAGSPNSAGYSGDGGAASTARLSSPKGVTVDSMDNLYISDTNNHCIRRVDAGTHVITTVVGTGSGGEAGDGGPANLAELKNPDAVAFDSAGNYYIADTNSHCIRRVDGPTNIITTVAGTKQKGGTGDGGSAVDARLDSPQGIWVGPGDHLFIADTGNSAVRRVDAATGIINTVAGQLKSSGYTGDGVAATATRLNSPGSIFITLENDMIISDTYNNRIRRVDGSTGVISTIAGTGIWGFGGDDGPAVSARVSAPQNAVPGPPSLEFVPELSR